MRKVNIIRFTIYHPHYKDKLSNQTQSFDFAVNNLHSLYSLSNHLIAFAYATKLGLVMNKRKLPKTSLYLFSHQSLFLFFITILSKIRPAILKY